MTVITRRTRSRGHQAPPAGDLVERRLPHDRDPDPDRVRAAHRGARRPVDRARPRRRDRQRQRRDGRRAARLHGRRHRLRARRCSTARVAGPRPRASTSTTSRATPRRCRSSTGSFDVVTLGLRRDVRARPGARPPRELLRVTRPGGRIGLVAHTPEGFIGQLFKTIARHVPPPAGLASPIQWGTEARLRELFGDADRRDPRRAAAVRLPRSLAEGLRRLLAPVLRPDAEGVRHRRRRRAEPPSRPTCST